MTDRGSGSDPLDVSAHPQRPRAAGDIDLADVLRGLWRGKWVILVAIIVSCFWTFNKLTKVEPTYRASMIVSATQSQGSSGLAEEITRIGAGLGLNIAGGSREVTQFDELEVVLGSHALASRLDEKYGLLRKVFGGWNEETASWDRPPKTWRDRVKDFLRQYINLPEWSAPTTQDLARLVKREVIVDKTNALPFVELRVLHADPQFAHFLLDIAYSEADSLLRDRQRKEVEGRLVYLKKKARRNND